MKSAFYLAALWLMPLAAIASAAESPQQNAALLVKRYNILFIAVDDLNDWVGCLGGNSQAITPNLDRLAKQQAMVMNRAYLASISYVDYCLGGLFDALAKSKHADNTIIMLWGDHGWHLSEKLKYGKTDLWEESDRVPFIVRVPGMTLPDFKCDGVVNLLDMYPTLVELCGLPPNPENEGRSFAPLLKNPPPIPTL